MSLCQFSVPYDPLSRSAPAYTILLSCSLALSHVNTLKSFSICWGWVIVFVYLHLIYIVGGERCSGKIDWIIIFYTRKWTKQQSFELIGGIYCVIIRHPWFVHRMHGSITFRKGGFISYEGPHLHYLRTSRERSRDFFAGFDVILKYYMCMLKKGGIRNTFTPPLDPSIHRLAANAYISSWTPLIADCAM